jgi:hypothetical protein
VVVHCFEVFWGASDVGFCDFEDKEVVAVDEAGIEEAAFETGGTLGNHGSFHIFGGLGRQFEFGEFVDGVAGAVADFYDLFGEVDGGDVDDTLPGAADHFERVIGRGDDAADEGGCEFHDSLPAEGHDVGLGFPLGSEQDDGAGLEVLADLVDGKIVFGVVLHAGILGWAGQGGESGRSEFDIWALWT